jgi:PAS domain S-box-containing protein
MEQVVKGPQLTPIRLVVAGIVCMSLYWIMDAGIYAHVARIPLSLALFQPEGHDVALRLLALAIGTFFIVCLARMQLQQRRQAALLESSARETEREKKRVEAILAAIGDAVSIQDTELRILYQNRAHQEMMGDRKGEQCYHAYRQRESVCENCHLVRSFGDGEVHRHETSTGAGDRTRHLEIISSPLKDPSGTIIAGIETVRDITERKAAERKLREQSLFLQRMIDTIPNPIYYKDEQLRYVGCNGAFAALVGVPREQITGRTVFDVTATVMAEQFDALDRELLQEGGVQTYEAPFRLANGSMHDMIFTKAAILSDAGEITGIVGVIVDIAERKAAEVEIHRLNRDLTARARELSRINHDMEAFNYSLSHDLRTPLTRIYASATALDEGHGEHLDDEGRFFLKNIIQGCEAAEGLIEAMMMLGSVSCSEISRQACNLSALVRDIAAGMMLNQKQRQLEFVVAPDVLVQGDPKLLRIALENLLGNALKYTRTAPLARIEFGVVDAGGGVREYFIRDNGAGFPMKDAARLFEPFQRLHASRDFPGYGIGLATVRRIVERHGGSIRGEGEPGQGATFSFTLT